MSGQSAIIEPVTGKPVAGDPWALSGMEELNRELEKPFAGFLQTVIAAPLLHSRFLNMLSLLEHIGSRKIMLTQMQGGMGRDVLKHMAEETRHAYFFKTRAERLNGHGQLGYSDADCLCRNAAVMYFQRLDAEISKAVATSQSPSFLPYLWVSLIVELRANWVYHLYQAMLVEAGSPLSLKSILAEEAGHMRDMYADIERVDGASASRVAGLAKQETKLFCRFWHQLKNAAAIAPDAKAGIENV
jgi:hypothetical protein